MVRISVAAIAVALLSSPLPAAAQSTSPKPAPRKTPTLSSKVVVPHRRNITVSSAACNRRAVGVNPPGNTMGPSGASQSQTLLAIPIGGGNAASATTQQQITDACNRRRH